MPQTTQTGFIAQDVQKVLPGLVSIYGDTTISLSDEKRETITNALGVNPTGLIPYLVKAIQEQQTEIEALQQEIEQLKAR